MRCTSTLLRKGAESGKKHQRYAILGDIVFQVSQFRDLDEHFKHSIESEDNSYFKNNRHTLGLGSCLKTKDKNEIYSLK